MYRPSVFLKAMRDQRWLVLGFGLGCALMAAFVLSVYPSYGESLADVDISPALTAIFGDIDLGSAEGFITAEFFSWVPILLVVYAIIQGTGVLAGEESNGTLDLLLAQPVTRIRLFIEKSMSLVVGTLMIIALTLPGWLIPYVAADIDVDLGALMLATAAMAPLTLAFAGLALLAGCLLPNRRDAAAMLTAVAVVSFFVNSLGQAVDVLDPLRPASLFFYFGAEDVLISGVDWLGVGVLLAVAVLSASAAGATFQRRDIGVVLTRSVSGRFTRLLPASDRRTADAAGIDGGD